MHSVGVDPLRVSKEDPIEGMTMNEYRFTGTEKATGQAITDVIRADDEDGVRAYAEARGVEIENIEVMPPVRSGAIASFFLGYGELVSLIGCASPAIYWGLCVSLETQPTAAGFAASVFAALYSASMLVVFSRVQRIAI